VNPSFWFFFFFFGGVGGEGFTVVVTDDDNKEYNLLDSFSRPSNMDMKKQINKCVIMSVKFIIIQIKFNIDVNNDRLLKIIWKHKKKIKIVDHGC
jgi:hypothetical protein